MDQYNVTITMSQSTVKDLLDNGFNLYVFKAVGTSVKSARPTVWVKTQTFSLKTQVTWKEQFAGYTSLQTSLSDGTLITASASYDMDLGSTLNVTDPTGTGTVVRTGTTGAIDIHNLTQTRFTCGISQVSNAGTNILCAVPLFGGHLDVIQPIEQVLLTFATDAVNTGTVIYQAFAPSLLVDMTGATDNTRTVSYDINSNWAGNTQSWAKQYPASTDLAPLLIQSSSQLADAAAEGVKSARLHHAAARALANDSNANAIQIPEGAYNNVTVTPVTGSSGYLSKGTGTMSSYGVFSCGQFASDDLPQVGTLSTIIATNAATGNLYQFPGNVAHSGPTSDFK